MVKTGKEIYFQDVMDLGFKAESTHDGVFMDQHGYSYVIVTYKLNDYLEIDWDMTTMEARLLNCDKDGSIKAKYDISGLEELKLIIKMTKKYG